MFTSRSIAGGIDPELRLRMRVKRPAVDNQVDQSKRSCVNELPILPWSAPSGENEILSGRRNATKETVHQ